MSKFFIALPLALFLFSCGKNDYDSHIPFSPPTENKNEVQSHCDGKELMEQVKSGAIEQTEFLKQAEICQTSFSTQKSPDLALSLLFYPKNEEELKNKITLSLLEQATKSLEVICHESWEPQIQIAIMDQINRIWEASALQNKINLPQWLLLLDQLHGEARLGCNTFLQLDSQLALHPLTKLWIQTASLEEFDSHNFEDLKEKIFNRPLFQEKNNHIAWLQEYYKGLLLNFDMRYTQNIDPYLLQLKSLIQKFQLLISGDSKVKVLSSSLQNKYLTPGIYGPGESLLHFKHLALSPIALIKTEHIDLKINAQSILGGLFLSEGTSEKQIEYHPKNTKESGTLPSLTEGTLGTKVQLGTQPSCAPQGKPGKQAPHIYIAAFLSHFPVIISQGGNGGQGANATPSPNCAGGKLIKTKLITRKIIVKNQKIRTIKEKHTVWTPHGEPGSGGSGGVPGVIELIHLNEQEPSVLKTFLKGKEGTSGKKASCAIKKGSP